MLVKDLSKDIRGKMHGVFRQIARTRPFCPIYEIDIDYNGDRYTVFMQLDKKLYVLYALQTVKSKREIHYELITQYSVLNALADLLVYQCKGLH